MVSTPSIVELNGVVLPESTATLPDRIGAGRYDWVNEQITAERFPLTLPAGPRNLALVHFRAVVASEQAEAWAKENGFEVALIDDLLAVGAHLEHKKLQQRFPIIALGSSADVRGERNVPCLSRADTRRELGLRWYEYGWHDGCRFLLRKKPPET